MTNEAEQDLKACFDLTDWTVFEAAATDLDELTETVTSYISFCEDMCIPTRTHLNYNNDKPWFTAKLRQLCQAKEDAYRKGNKSCIKQANTHWKRRSEWQKRNYSGKAKEHILFQWFCFSVERYERNHQLQDTIPQHCSDSTNGRRSEWVLLQVWKNTIHTSCNPPLPHTCTADKWRRRAPGLQNEQKKESTRPRRCVTSLPKNLCWPAGPHLHTDLQQITGAVRSPLMLQTLHHHPVPKKPKLLDLMDYKTCGF